MNGQPPPTFDTVKFLKEQIDKPPAESKKWILINRGMWGILFVFVVSSGLLFIKPELAGNIATISSVTLTAWGGLLAVGVSAIAAVDYKNTSSLENVAKVTNGTPPAS